MPETVLSPKLTIHYIDLNPDAERTILLLHGLGANGSSWQLQFPELTALGYRIIAPDTRGFGQSSYPSDSSFSIPATARDFAELISTLRLGQVDVVGISMGGTQALALALDCPALIRRLVLVNTFARLRPHGLNEWLYYAMRFILVHTLGLEAQARMVASRVFPAPQQSELRGMLIQQVLEADPKAYRAAMRALAKFDVARRLSEISIPTLIVTGELDTTVPREVQQQLADGIPLAQHIRIPGAGHALSVDSSGRFNLILKQFLAE